MSHFFFLFIFIPTSHTLHDVLHKKSQTLLGELTSNFPSLVVCDFTNMPFFFLSDVCLRYEFGLKLKQVCFVCDNIRLDMWTVGGHFKTNLTRPMGYFNNHCPNNMHVYKYFELIYDAKFHNLQIKINNFMWLSYAEPLIYMLVDKVLRHILHSRLHVRLSST